jgi:hypothetical protein
VEREQRDELAGLARERARAAHDVDARRSDERVDLCARVPLVPQQEERREQVVEPSTAAREHEDPLGAGRGGEVERELEVGRVLVGRVADDARTLRLGGGYRVRGGGVEVADRDRDVEPERGRGRAPSAAITCVGAAPERRLRARSLAARDHHHDLFRHAFLRWHYPDQVLRVGGAVAALSARLPELPVTLEPW